MRAHHGECVFPRGVEPSSRAWLISYKPMPQRANEANPIEAEDQLRRRADNKPDPDERIDETQKNEVRRFRREIGETFGQASLRSAGRSCAHDRSGSSPNR